MVLFLLGALITGFMSAGIGVLMIELFRRRVLNRHALDIPPTWLWSFGLPVLVMVMAENVIRTSFAAPPTPWAPLFGTVLVGVEFAVLALVAYRRFPATSLAAMWSLKAGSTAIALAFLWLMIGGMWTYAHLPPTVSRPPSTILVH